MTDQNSEISSSTVGLSIPRKAGRGRSVLLGLIILLCGILIGAGVTIVVLHKVVLHAIHHPEEMPRRVTERLRHKLGLSDEQAVKVRAILTERQKAFQELRRAARPKVEREIERLKEEIASVLDEKQARKWREQLEKLRRKWVPPPTPDRQP
ncbi:MAG TPA: hypothetical protein VMC85_11710 [Desulfomonilaceae bacterium]|nr:hypothetical protein [Desulfomonilaceae bacterium]